jgi:hypothetical protein
MTFVMTTARTPQETRKLWLVLGCFVCLILGMGTGCSPVQKAESQAVTFPTPYQAVLLINNSVYYGKLAGWGTPNPVLTDVFYIVSKTNPDTKEVANILVKRGKELHGPDRMYLNPNQIIFVEPVGPDSKVAQLINEAEKKQ